MEEISKSKIKFVHWIWQEAKLHGVKKKKSCCCGNLNWFKSLLLHNNNQLSSLDRQDGKIGNLTYDFSKARKGTWNENHTLPLVRQTLKIKIKIAKIQVILFIGCRELIIMI